MPARNIFTSPSQAARAQAQRNQAMDAAAVSDARLAQMTDDLAKANARIKEIEPKPDDLKK